MSFSDDGALLATVSDDCHALIWDASDHDRPGVRLKQDLWTQHRLNIFGVGFLPETGNSMLVTCAMDREVRLHNLELGNGHAQIFKGHSGRVKQVETTPGCPNVFFSASEDGSVRRYDRRVPDVDTGPLVALRAATIKTLAIARSKPHLMAFGGAGFNPQVIDLRFVSQESSKLRTLWNLAPSYISFFILY